MCDSRRVSVREVPGRYLDGIRNVRVPFVVQCGLAFVALLALAYLLRGSAMHSPGVFNPDEAELLAEGRLAAHHLLPPYGAYTSATFLFLWPLGLGILGAVGIHLTLPTAHVLSALAYVTIFLVPGIAIALRAGWRWAAVIVGPAFVLVLAQTTADFAALGTELLGIVCILVGAAIVLIPRRAPSRTALLLACAVIGTAPWSKPQDGVLALVALIEMAVIASLRDPRGLGALRRNAVLAVIGAVAPTVVFIVWMLAAGTFSRFLHEPVDITLAYSLDRSSIYGGYAPPGLITRTGDVASFVIGFPLAFMPALAPLVCGGNATGLNQRLRLALWLMPLAAAVVSMFGSYPLFPHYANIIYGAGALSGLSMAALANPRAATGPESVRPRWAPVSPAAHGLAVLSVLFMLMSGVPAIQSNLQALKVAPASPASPALTRPCPAGSRVFVWGWASELYAFQNWTPASRYVNPLGAVLSTTPYHRYWVRTLIGELEGRPPRCVVEVGAGFFDTTAATPTLPEAVPALAPWLRRHYTPPRTVSLVDGRQLTLLTRVSRT